MNVVMPSASGNATPAVPLRRGAVDRFPYLPALDGLRGLLVFPVVLYHFTFFGEVLGYRVAVGSYLAPSMFFTLSGFLITSLILIEHRKSDTVNWGAFWNRRFRRLIPGSVAVVAFAVIVGLLFSRAWPAVPVSDVAASLFSFKNWQSVHLESTHQGLRNLGPLGPYWSLAVEEQFYVGLSLLVWVSTRFRAWRTVLSFGLITIGTFSILRMILLDGTVTRVFFGTDVRASELVSGCLLALVIERYGWPRHKIFHAVGWVSLLLTVCAWAFLSETSSFIVGGGLALASFLNIGLICAATQSSTAFVKAFSWKPLVELGKISYPAYLIHWPVTILLKTSITGLSGWPLVLLCFVVTIALAVPLAYIIEAPIRKQRILRGWKFFALWGAINAVLIAIAMSAR